MLITVGGSLLPLVYTYLFLFDYETSSSLM